jgi:hypothetical protein
VPAALRVRSAEQRIVFETISGHLTPTECAVVIEALDYASGALNWKSSYPLCADLLTSRRAGACPRTLPPGSFERRCWRHFI